MSKPENPSAFPVSTIDGYTADGMTLRDWFAGQALAAWLSDGLPRSLDSTVAAEAYGLADAMLAERERSTQSADPA